MIFTDERIDDLIRCPKTITKPPTKNFKSDRGSLRKDFEVSSVDGKHSFYCFIRINETFMENFSIGLDYQQIDEAGTIMLLRCNGAHGPHRTYQHHHFFHIHRATAESIEKGLNPESSIEVTQAYGSYQEAILHFLMLTNIKDGDQHFPFTQQELFSV